MIMTQTALRGVQVPSLHNLSVYDYDGPEDANRAAVEQAQREADADLLDLVADQEPDLRSEGQARYMDSLISDLAELDSELGRQARQYTDNMTQHGAWVPGRDGNASAWIDRLIAKLAQVRAAQRPRSTDHQALTEIPAGRYAVTDGEVKCYTVEYGREGTRWAGFLFLARISSDDQFPIRNRDEKARILAAIRADVEASAILAGLTLRQCRRCGRTLSDTKNPYFEVALGPQCGAK